MKRGKIRVLVSQVPLCLLLLGASARAQVVYQISSTPTFVISTGRAEVLGDVRITAIGPAAPGNVTVSGTAEFLYENIGCENNTTNGVSLNLSVGFAAAATPPSISGVTNTAAGCVVSVTMPAGITVTLGVDFMEVRGVRGRVDLSPGATPGTDIVCRLNASPSTSMLFTAPTVVRVATSQPGKVVSITNGIFLACVGTSANVSQIRITEGFAGAFVQHVTSQAGNPPPLDARPVVGALNNTQIKIVAADVPAGVILTWPAVVAGVNVIAGGPAAGSFQRRSSATDTTQIYEFVTSSQATSDTNKERFDVSPTVTLAGPVFGLATVQVQLAPELIPNDATDIITQPFGAAVAGPVFKPRFNDPPSSADPSEPHFTLALSPSSQSVAAGGSATYTVSINAVSGFNEPVGLYCVELPAGASCSIAPNPTLPGTATFMVHTSSTTPSGTFNVRMIGISVPVAQSTTASLTVGPRTPTLEPASITNGASFAPGITSGSIVTIFGANLTKDVTGVVPAPAVFPLPLDLRGTSVSVNGVLAPLFAIASSGGQDQINLQVPYEVTGQTTVTVVVNNNGVASGGVQATLLAAHPGIFTVDGTNGVIVHSANFQLISAASPAARDEVVVAYATGLGPVSNAPRTGLPALLSPLSQTLLPPTVTVGGVPAEILFSGLAPNFAGLFQVNFRVPGNVPVGIADVVIQVSGQSSRAVKMAVQ